MRRIHSVIVIPIVAISVGLPERGEAQEPASIRADRISLDDALLRFEAENLDLHMARAGVSAARARSLTAGAFPNPGISLHREQLSVDGGASYRETIFTLGQTIEIGGQRGIRMTGAGESLRASEERLDAERVRLGFEVYRAYIAAAVAEANLEAVREATEVFRRVEEAGEERFQEGDISRFDYNRLQVERARYETLLAQGELEVGEIARELALLVAPESSASTMAFLPSESIGEIDVPESGITLEAALLSASNRADVQAAEAVVRAGEASLSLARRNRVPDLTLLGGYKTQADGFRGAVLGLSLPLPVWNRGRGEIDESQANLDAATLGYDLALRRAQADIRRAWEIHNSLRELRLAVGDELLQESDGLLETGLTAYSEGEMSLLELLDAADAFQAAQTSRNKLLGDYLISFFELQRSTGGLLDLISDVSNTTPR